MDHNADEPVDARKAQGGEVVEVVEVIAETPFPLLDHPDNADNLATLRAR